MATLTLSPDDCLRLAVVLTTRSRHKMKDHRRASEEGKHELLVASLIDDATWCQNVAALALEAAKS